MPKKNSRTKGAVGERELAAVLTEIFGVACRRGQQFKGGQDSPDVAGLPGIHVESKRTERLSLYNAVDQAVGDAGSNVPVVMHRCNRREWVAIVRLEDLTRLAKAICDLLPETGTPEYNGEVSVT